MACVTLLLVDMGLIIRSAFNLVLYNSEDDEITKFQLKHRMLKGNLDTKIVTLSFVEASLFT